MKPRGGQSPAERRARSRMRFLLQDRGLLRASRLTLKTQCGKPTCRCAEGKRHRARVVEQSKGGKTRMQTVPPASEAEIAQWIETFREVEALLEQLSDLYWETLQAKKR